MWLLIEPQSEKAHTEDVSRKVLHASRFPNIKAVKRASNDHGTDAGTHAETITYAREIRSAENRGVRGGRLEEEKRGKEMRWLAHPGGWPIRTQARRR